jgi:hypothetical protein
MVRRKRRGSFALERPFFDSMDLQGILNGMIRIGHPKMIESVRLYRSADIF